MPVVEPERAGTAGRAAPARPRAAAPPCRRRRGSAAGTRHSRAATRRRRPAAPAPTRPGPRGARSATARSVSSSKRWSRCRPSWSWREEQRACIRPPVRDGDLPLEPVAIVRPLSRDRIPEGGLRDARSARGRPPGDGRRRSETTPKTGAACLHRRGRRPSPPSWGRSHGAPRASRHRARRVAGRATCRPRTGRRGCSRPIARRPACAPCCERPLSRLPPPSSLT